MGLAKGNRTLTWAVLLGAALNQAACGSEDEISQPEPRGWGCVSVLDQQGEKMKNCTFNYKLKAEGWDFTEKEDFKGCDEGELFVYGAPGTFNVNAECGKLYGRVAVEIEEGNAATQDEAEEYYEVQERHLEGSLCTSDNTPTVIYEKTLEDEEEKLVDVSESMGFMSATRCGGDKWYDQDDVVDSTIIKITRDCPEEKGPDCDPEDGWRYAEVVDERKNVISQGKQLHFMVQTYPERIARGETETINLTIRHETNHQQEIVLPIEIRGPKAADSETTEN